MEDNDIEIDSELLEDDKFDNKNQIEIIKPSQLEIECKTPEIGTKIENFSTDNINIQKDYYNNQYKTNFFYPFFNMDKEDKNIDNKYTLKYNEGDRFNLYLYKENKYKKIKLQINNKSIIQITYKKNNNNIELFIYLKSVPKIYSKEDCVSIFESFYFENFRNNLNNYDYYNLYRNIDKNESQKYFKVAHNAKNLIKNNNNKNKSKIHLPNDEYQREVSFFSMKDEYNNLYLNDLVIKIKFKNKDNKFQQLRSKLKNIKVKFKDNNFLYEKIESIDTLEKQIIKKLLLLNTKQFYENFKKLIPNLQFSLMSLLTIQQINIFNFDLKILNYIFGKSKL